MRVLFVSNAQSIHTVRWVNALTRLGHEVHLAHIAGHEPSLDRLEERIVVHRLPAGGTAGYFLNASRLRRVADAVRPAVVNVHYASGYGTLARMAGLRSVLSVWGSDVYDFPHQGPLQHAVLTRNVRFAAMLASTSHCMADELRTVMKDPALRINVTPFGVDLAKFDPGRSPRSGAPGRTVVGNIKALEPKYGVDVLVRAVALLSDRLERGAVELRVFGEGSQRGELEQLVRDLGVEDIVAFPGRIPNDEVPRALSELDIFCATSMLDSESFGVSVVEAMAMRRPVVVSDVAGFAEVVADAGIVVPRGDVDAAAAALERLIHDPARRLSLARAGRQRVEDEYDWDENVDRMVELYTRFSEAR